MLQQLESQILQIKPETGVERDEFGRLRPGASLNPGGRPRTRHIREALTSALESGDAEKLAKELLGMAKVKKHSGLKLAAISEIADRTEGKAVQNIRHAGVFMVMAPGEDVLMSAFGSLPPSDDAE